MTRMILAVFLGAFAFLIGPEVPKWSGVVPQAMADDDGGGGGGNFSRGGFGAAKSFLKFAPRVFRGLGYSKRRVKYSGRRQARAVPLPERRPREIVVVGLSDTDLDRLTNLGFVPLGRRPNGIYNASISRLRVPARDSVRQALARVQNEIPGITATENNIYKSMTRSFYEPSGSGCGIRCEAFEITAWTDAASRCSRRSRIGVVDTGVDLAHPSLNGARISVKTFRSDDRPPSDTEHGTAVLSLLVGLPDSDVVGLAHGAEVLHADAFHGEGKQSQTDVFDLVSALDWLVSQNVNVLNLSFSGPENILLGRAIAAAQNSGIHIVAAAGRPDRGQSSGYPARYDGVIAVAAIDGRLRPSRLSSKGAHVAFAAPGVGLNVAHGKDSLRSVDGTSFAAPFVTAAFAMSNAAGRPQSDITRALARSARDLGSPGRDATYGWGLLQYSEIPGC